MASKFARRYTVEEMAEAIRKSHGILAGAAAMLGCSRATVHKFVNRYQSCRDAYTEESETLVDFAEQQLYKEVQDRNITAIIFTLKTKGRKRGWVERQEIVTANVDDIDAAIESELARLAGKRKVTAAAPATGASASPADS